MTDRERTKLRKLQDRFLGLAVTAHFIQRYGEDEAVFGPGSPTVRQIRGLLYASYERQFQQTIDEHERST